MSRKKLALVLSGGGARGAYQAGILKAWEGIFKKDARIEIICGVSAGAINAVEMVQNANDFPLAIQNITKRWLSLQTSDIFESGLRGVMKNVYRLTRSSRKSSPDLESPISGAILNTHPLYQFLIRNFDMGKVHRSLENDPEMAMLINCFDYTDMKNVTFFQGENTIPGWERPARRGIRTNLTVNHVMASCAVPFIFPTINIDGHYYGDGSLRNMAPLGPVIKLGAEKIICINLRGKSSTYGSKSAPNLGKIAGAFLDSMFLDAVEYDSSVMNRMNILTSQIPKEKRTARIIDFCNISPLINFGELAENFRHKFPRSLHRIMGGWISSDLLSYLLFDGAYGEALIEQGFKDGNLYIDVVEEWLLAK